MADLPTRKLGNGSGKRGLDDLRLVSLIKIPSKIFSKAFQIKKVRSLNYALPEQIELSVV